MQAEDGAVHDRHRCRCHKVPAHKIRKLRDRLTCLGFEPVPEDHGHVPVMRRRLSEHGQLHVKVMPNGRIEAKIAHSPEYSQAHIGQKHSCSAHRAVIDVLGKCEIKFRTEHVVPSTCLDPMDDRPCNPARRKGLAAPFKAATEALVGAAAAAADRLRS